MRLIDTGSVFGSCYQDMNERVRIDLKLLDDSFSFQTMDIGQIGLNGLLAPLPVDSAAKPEGEIATLQSREGWQYALAKGREHRKSHANWHSARHVRYV